MSADHMVLSAEKALLDTKGQIKAHRRQARHAVTRAEQHEIQEKVQHLSDASAALTRRSSRQMWNRVEN